MFKIDSFWDKKEAIKFWAPNLRAGPPRAFVTTVLRVRFDTATSASLPCVEWNSARKWHGREEVVCGGRIAVASQLYSLALHRSTRSCQIRYDNSPMNGKVSVDGFHVSTQGRGRAQVMCTCVASADCWHHIKMASPVVDLLWTGHPSVAACNRRWSVICCCWPQALAHCAWGHYICAVFTGVSTKTENAFVSAILSVHYIVAFWLVAPGGPWSYTALKNL